MSSYVVHFHDGKTMRFDKVAHLAIITGGVASMLYGKDGEDSIYLSGWKIIRPVGSGVEIKDGLRQLELFGEDDAMDRDDSAGGYI